MADLVGEDFAERHDCDGVCFVGIRGDSRIEKRFFSLARNLTLESDEDRRCGMHIMERNLDIEGTGQSRGWLCIMISGRGRRQRSIIRNMVHCQLEEEEVGEEA